MDKRSDRYSQCVRALVGGNRTRSRLLPKKTRKSIRPFNRRRDFMKTKHQVREQFRTNVFNRDGNKCRICNDKHKLDAHHITDRHEMPSGGYVVENGISLCPVCHLKAEQYHMTDGAEFVPGFHPDELYQLIGSSKEIAFRCALARSR